MNIRVPESQVIAKAWPAVTDDLERLQHRSWSERSAEDDIRSLISAAYSRGFREGREAMRDAIVGAAHVLGDTAR